jgi:hypothetical protein
LTTKSTFAPLFVVSAWIFFPALVPAWGRGVVVVEAASSPTSHQHQPSSAQASRFLPKLQAEGDDRSAKRLRLDALLESELESLQKKIDEEVAVEERKESERYFDFIRF